MTQKEAMQRLKQMQNDHLNQRKRGSQPDVATLIFEQQELRNQHLYPNFELADNQSIISNEHAKIAKLRVIGAHSVAAHHQGHPQFQRAKRNSLQQKE
jgi:hypothetical protein